MASNTSNESNGTQFLVLGDDDGNYYALPLSVVEQHKATEAQTAQIEQSMASDDA